MTRKVASKRRPVAPEDLRERLLGELRGGAEGVRRWNALPPEERAAAGVEKISSVPGWAMAAGVIVGC